MFHKTVFVVLALLQITARPIKSQTQPITDPPTIHSLSPVAELEYQLPHAPPIKSQTQPITDPPTIHSISPVAELQYQPLNLYDRYASLCEDVVDLDDNLEYSGDSLENPLPTSDPSRLTSELLNLASTSRVLTAILQRGRELWAQLPHIRSIVRRKLIEHIPTPSDILNFGKQTLLALPQEVIVYAFDSICSSAISYRKVRPRNSPDLSALNYVLRTVDEGGEEVAEVHIPLADSQQLWQHPRFRRDWRVVLVITGWNSNVNTSNEALDGLYAAYKCRGRYNFVGLDMAEYMDTLYTWSAYSSRPVGRMVGEALANLTQFVRPEMVHVIGHSLGAHVSGEAGRRYQLLTNRTLPRITGLDPARPCFNEGESLNGLQRGDAQFVDIIHSNSGILGQRRAMGDVDFYPNGRDPLQPGCWTIFCAHSRAWQYFAESVYPGNERNFDSLKCHKLGAYKRGRCIGQPIPMGLAADGGRGTGWGQRTPSGTYFLVTNGESPFGQSTRAAETGNYCADGTRHQLTRT